MVDAKGLITAVAEGTAKVTATVGKLSKECVVTVTKTEDNGGGSTSQDNELPLLKFDPNGDNDADILAHETKIGRIAQDIKLWDGEDGVKPGFVNKSLTITGAIYNLAAGNNSAILALSKETLANCPKTLAMLAEYGFTSLDDLTDPKDGSSFKAGINDKDNTMGVQLYDEAISDTESTLQILFLKAGSSGQQDIPTSHPVIPNVKDFPSWTTFMTGDVAQMKAFEENLGFRNFTPEESDVANKNISFDTPEGKMDQTNFVWVFYVTTPTSGTQFINSQINFIKNATDFKDPKFKEWLTANGYGYNLDVDLADGVATSYDASGKICCYAYINQKYKTAQLELYEESNTQSAAQMRRLASEQYEKAQSRMILKQNELQQLRRR